MDEVNKNNDNKYTDEISVSYALLLERLSRVGLIVLVILFLLYVTGVIVPHIPMEQLPEHWGNPASHYLKAAELSGGWSWVSIAHRADYLCFGVIVFLASITVFCYLRIIPIFVREKNKIYTAIAITEIIVLVLAASGILVSGH